jgi:hypothetical protein
MSRNSRGRAAHDKYRRHISLLGMHTAVTHKEGSFLFFASV